ncbi:hypothetical protein GKA92_24435 [Salmonella enterica subsp. enterica]|nr:hypothetical protein [Salmonella enterica subsp. enterica serovar Abaetetuba]
MSDYGIRIYHPDGSHFDFNERSTLCRVLGIGGGTGFKGTNYNGETYSFSTGLRVPEGYEWWLWNSLNANQNWGLLAAAGEFGGFGPSGPSVSTPYLDDNRVINIRWDYSGVTGYASGRSIGRAVQRIDSLYGAVAWPVAQPRDYGFQIYGTNNLAGVFDTSLVSYLLWKGEIDIHDGWSPQNINPKLSLRNCICFFHTTDPNYIIGIDTYARYRVWLNGRNASAPVRAKVCIFGNGEPLSPLSDYGLEVWDPQTGQRVYNSGRDVLMRPQLVSVATAISLVGSTIKYSSVNVPGIRRPMYAPTNTGAGVGEGVAFNDNGDSMYGFYTWVTSDGYYLHQRPGGQQNPFEEISGNHKVFGYDNPDYKNGTNPVMVIDAEDYFVF